MTGVSTDVSEVLTGFVNAYLEQYPNLYEVFDPQWRSPCEMGEPFTAGDDTQLIAWQPLARRFADDFGGLERALEGEVHPDIKAYYGGFWSGGLEATAPDGHVSLILLWNADDAVRLQENLIGHLLAKQRARSPFTVFFACTEPDSDLFLSVDNASGAVVLEKPGSKPIRQVADSLAEFLQQLEPAAPELHPERAGISR